MNPSLGDPQNTRSDTSPPRVAAFAALVAMLLVLLSLPSAAQVVVNTSSLMSNWSGGTGTITQTLVANPSGTFTIPASYPSGGMLVVTIAGEVNVGPTSVTWGGVTMNPATSTSSTPTGNNAGYSGIYYLANPASGTGPLVVSYTGTRFSAYAVFATGVSPVFQTSKSAIANSTSGANPFVTNTPVSITPTAGALVVTSYGAAPTTGSGTILIPKIVRASDNFVLPNQTTPPKAPNANSSAGSGHAITDDTSPIKGSTENNLSGATAMTIASFDAAGAAVYNNLAVAPASGLTAGVPFDVTITGRDSANATVNDSTATIVVSSPSLFVEFDWNGDEIYGDNSGTLNSSTAGVKTIRARNNKAEATTIVANGGGATGSAPVTVAPAAYAKLQILAPGEVAAPGTATGKTSAAPSLRTLSVAFNVTVNAVDEFWNPVPGSTSNTIAITSNDPLATLPSPAALATNGASFSVTLNTLGVSSLTLTATDTTDSSKAAATTSLLTVLGMSITWAGDGSANLWNTDPGNTIWNAIPVAYADTNQVTFGTTGSVFPAVTINSTVTPSKITVNNTLPSSNYTFEGSGSIAGAIGGFTKSGTGLLTLSTSNSYTGPTTVSGGVMILNNANALPAASALTLSGGLIGLTDVAFTRSPGLAAGQVNLVSGGFAGFGTSGVVNLGGNSTPVQLTMGTAGFFDTTNTLSLGHAEATTTIDLQNPIALRNGTNFFQVADSGSTPVDAILSGAITTPLGGSGLSKGGDGTLMLSNTGNSFNQCFIDSGTIMLGAADVLPNAANFVVKRGGASGADSVVDLNGFSDTLGTLNFGDTGAGNGGMPSVINLDISTPAKAAAVLTLNGNLNYNAGTVASPYGQAIISANLATGTAGNRNITVNDGSNAEDLVISGALTGGAITKAGLGVLVVTNPLYSGNTTISAGKLIVRKAGAQTNANPNNDASTVTITTGATLNLEYAGTDTVFGLVIGITPLASGVYSAAEYPTVIFGTGTITVVSDPYLSWAGAGVPFDGDSNSDGVQNGLAWLLGAANPTANANGLLPVPTAETGGSLKMTFNMLNAASRGTSTVEVQHSSDLGISDPWTGVPVPNTSGGPTNGVIFVITPGSPLNGVQATIAPSEAAGGKVFSRLKGLK